MDEITVSLVKLQHPTDITLKDLIQSPVTAVRFGSDPP